MKAQTSDSPVNQISDNDGSLGTGERPKTCFGFTMSDKKKQKAIDLVNLGLTPQAGFMKCLLRLLAMHPKRIQVVLDWGNGKRADLQWPSSKDDSVVSQGASCSTPVPGAPSGPTKRHTGLPV